LCRSKATGAFAHRRKAGAGEGSHRGTITRPEMNNDMLATR
jgi:hypothetical protein